MTAVNAFFGAVFGALLAPFEGLPILVTLVPISLVVTAFALLVFKWTSNQEAMDRVKDQEYAGIFEIRLFNDDMRAIFRAQAHIFWSVLKHMALIVVPLLWMLVPLGILVPQLEAHYGTSGLEPGEPVLLKVTLEGEASPTAPNPGFELSAPPGVEVQTPAIWVPARNEVLWRVAARERGSFELEITNGSGETTTKTLVSSDEVVRRSPFKSASLATRLLYPAEAPPESPFHEISLAYPARTVNFLGWETHWLWIFLILTIVFGFALKGPMGVTI